MAALLRPSTLPGQTNDLHLLTPRAAVPQIRVETLIGIKLQLHIKIVDLVLFYFMDDLLHDMDNTTI